MPDHTCTFRRVPDQEFPLPCPTCGGFETPHTESWVKPFADTVREQLLADAEKNNLIK